MSYSIEKGRAKFRYGMSNPEQLRAWLDENPNAIGVSFVGRSNVGKSSTINSLFGRKTARVSNTPGRTREINIFTFEIREKGNPELELPPLYLFDLPGYGHAEVSREMSRNWNELMGVFFEGSGQNTLMINIQDARHPNQKSDQGFQDYLQNFNFDTFLVFNKMDKLKKQKERAALNKLKPQLFKEFKWVKQIYFCSAESGAGLSELEQSIITYIFDRIALEERMNSEQED